MKTIRGRYEVADCEHSGDIDREKNYLRSLGCEVTNHYWDGDDCGEAYIQFKCKESDFVRLYNTLGCSASFDANINDYVKVDVKGLNNYKRMSRDELLRKVKEMENDLTDGFWNRLPFHLWFELGKSKGFTTEDIVNKCLSYLTKDKFSVVGFSTCIVDGNEYLDMLIETSYKNMDKTTIGDDGCGDYCQSHYGWLGRNGIYGECDCNHVFCNRLKMGYSYEYLQKVMEKVINREPLVYKHNSYYNGTTIKVEYCEYFMNNKLHTSVERNGAIYNIKDPRFWVKG